MNPSVVHLGKHYFPDFGGIETATRDLAEAAAGLGYEVTCYTSATRRARRRVYDCNGVQIHRALTLGKWMSTPVSPGTLRVRAYTRVVLHVHLPNPLAEISALLHVWRNGRRCALLPFFHALPRRQGWLGRQWFRFVTRTLLQRAEFILVSNPHLLHTFPELREFTAKVRTQPFTVDVLSREQSSALWAQGRDGKFIFAVGRLVPYKGFQDLLAAWAQVRASFPEKTLVIAGDGPLRDSLLAQAESLGLGDSVRFLFHCSEAEKETWFNRASLFVLPSRNESETFGIAALEAMARGIPLLTTDVPTGLALLAREGACGHMAKAESVESLAAGLRGLLSLPLASLAEIGEKNRAFSEANYSRQFAKQSYGALLRSLFDSKDPRRAQKNPAAA